MLTIGFRSLPFVTNPCKSLLFLTHPCKSLQIHAHPHESVLILTNPSHSLQFLTSPDGSLQIPTMPYYSLQFFTIPYCSIWILAIPYTSLQFLPNHQYERFCHSVHNTKGSAQATAWASSDVEPAGFDWVFLGKMVVNHVLLATLHRCIFNIPKEDDENYPLRWVVSLSCRSVCLFPMIKACLQGFLPSSKNWFLSAASAEGSSAFLGIDYIKHVFFKQSIP